MTKAPTNTSKRPTGDFYVQQGCCTYCGVPQKVAPDLVGLTKEEHCYWIKQPETLPELNQAIELLRSQELGCHRYAGSDPSLLAQLPSEDCDHFRPDLKLSDRSLLTSFGPAPKFSPFASDKGNVFQRIWRILRKE